MGKVRVLMVGSDNTVKGGITSVITQLLKYNWNNDNIEMKFLPTFIEGSGMKRSFFFFKGILYLLTLIIGYRPKLVHIHMSHNGSFYRKYIVNKICKLFGIKSIIHLHSSEFKEFFKNGNEKRKKRICSLLRECDRVFVLGENWNREIIKIESQAKTIVLNNSVSLPSIVKKREEEFINVLFLGVLVERKGVMDLLKAADILNREGTLSNLNVKFKIGGTGNEEIKLKEYVEKNNLSNSVDFLGWVNGEEKQNYLSESHIFVLPSYNEGLPIAILEALSWGVPVISTCVGSIDEAVTNDYNGYLIQPGDVGGLAKKLKLLILNESLRLIFGENSRLLAEERFNETHYYETIIKTYRQLMS